MKAYITPILMGLTLLQADAFASGKPESLVDQTLTQASSPLSMDQFNPDLLRNARHVVRPVVGANLLEQQTQFTERMAQTNDHSTVVQMGNAIRILGVKLNIMQSPVGVDSLNEFIIKSLAFGEAQPYLFDNSGTGVMEALSKAGFTLESLKK